MVGTDYDIHVVLSRAVQLQRVNRPEENQAVGFGLRAAGWQEKHPLQGGLAGFQIPRNEE